MVLSAVLAVVTAVSWAGEGPGTLISLTQGNNEFAVNLYKQLAAANKGNIFCSPYSISSALAMTYSGAAGETAREMAKVLRFHAPGARLHEGFADLIGSLNAEGKRGKIELSVANALWGQKGYGFKKGFLDLTRRYYGAGLHEQDFFKDAEASRRTINAWVERETRDKIKELIAPGVLNGSTRLVLTNAIFFKGQWVSQFKKGNTKNEPFHKGAGKDISVALMKQTAEFGYMETPEFQALELPYVGNRLSMVVFLPNQAEGLGALEAQLSYKNLTGWLGRLRHCEVEVYLPRFKTTSEFQLKSYLRSMGMKAAFTPPSGKFRPQEADFSGMDGKRDLYISVVVHKAFVDVGEEGTEAAAATAVLVDKMMSLPSSVPVFRADHPFLFLIRDKDSGSILFLGRMSDPTG